MKKILLENLKVIRTDEFLVLPLVKSKNMGKLTKLFKAKTTKGSANGRGKIDTGADVTILRWDIACALGLDISKAPLAAMGTATGRMTGFNLPIELSIGNKKGKLTAFVPMFKVDGDKMERIQVTNNLIGHDFLQEAKVKLDYNKPHNEVLGVVSWPEEWSKTTIKPKEKEKLRNVRSCPTKPKQKK